MEKNYYISEVKVGQKVANFEAEALLNDGTFGKVSLEENQHEVKYGDILFTGSSEIASDIALNPLAVALATC